MRETVSYACLITSEKEDQLKIELKVPGIDRGDVALEMKKDRFCMSPVKTEQSGYSGCCMLPCEVDSDRADIRFESGLLKVSVPIAKGLEQKRVYRPEA